jgi:hypothetical protein
MYAEMTYESVLPSLAMRLAMRLSSTAPHHRWPRQLNRCYLVLTHPVSPTIIEYYGACPLRQKSGRPASP